MDADYVAPEERRDIEESFGRRPITRSQTTIEAKIRRRTDITVMVLLQADKQIGMVVHNHLKHHKILGK